MSRPHSVGIMYDVAEFVAHVGSITVGEILREFPGRTKYQIQDALHNAAQRKLVTCTRRGRYPAIWRPYTDQSEIYAQLMPKEEPRPLISSVFELGTPKPESAWPKARGTVHTPLGGWNEETELQPRS